jgi:hypothetical protein
MLRVGTVLKIEAHEVGFSSLWSYTRVNMVTVEWVMLRMQW